MDVLNRTLELTNPLREPHPRGFPLLLAGSGVLVGLLLPGCALLLATSPRSESSERHSEMTEMVETDLGPDAEPDTPKPNSASAKAKTRKHEPAEPVFDDILAEPGDGVAPDTAGSAQQASPAAASVAATPAPEVASTARPPAAEVVSTARPPATVVPATVVPAPVAPATVVVAPARAAVPAPLPLPIQPSPIASRPVPRGARRANANANANANASAGRSRDDTDLISRAVPAPYPLATADDNRYAGMELTAGRPNGADLSRSPTLAGDGKWDCPFPHEASRLGINSAVVTLRVEVKANSAVDSVIVIQDPGDGFGREARRCVLSKRWQPGLDRAGNAARRTTVVNIRFQRKG